MAAHDPAPPSHTTGVPAHLEMVSIGAVSRGSGLSTSTLHYYESQHLIASMRTPGNHRQYRRHVFLRLAVISLMRHLGHSISQIQTVLSVYPADRAPTLEEWRAVAAQCCRLCNLRQEALQQLMTLDDCDTNSRGGRRTGATDGYGDELT